MQKHPISHPQMRILNSEMVNQNTPLNNVPVSAFYPLNSHNSLEKALTYLVNTTPDINIRFSLEENGDITQYLGEPKEPLIERYDLRDKTDRDIDLLLDTLSAKPFGNVFDVPMYVFAVIQTRTQTILFVNFYHGICDGSSLNIFMDHLDILYDAANNGQAFFPLHSNTMSYLAVEKNYLSSTACDADKTYFTELLSDLADFPEKINATDSYAANRVNVVLDKSLSKRLKTYLDGFTKPISPFIFMLALSGFYFARFHNTKGSVFCMGYANRVYDEEINGSLGMYVSTVPIKIMAQKQQTFEELMLCAKESMKQSLIHSRYPFDMLLGDLHQQDAEKLLNVAIVSNACKDTLYSRNIGDLKTSIAGITLRVNPFRDDAQGLQTFCFEYKTACYDESTIITMKDGMIALIEEVLNHPDRLCVDIPIVSKSQKQMLLTTFNNTAVNYQDTSASIVLMFKNQAQKTPDNIAVIFEDRQLTYQQIDAITDKLAKKLVASGVKKEDVVGVMIDRSELMVIFPLAVLKAGGAYMPLDYTFPSDRLEYMLADAGVGIILSEGNRPIQHIPNFKGMIISAEDLETMTVAEDVVLPQPEARDKFIILYTSGSTGQPKGCVLEHESLANFCKWYQRYYKITETDRIGAYANFGFDAHMMDLYPLITSGGAVCIIPSGIRLDFILLNEYFEKNRVTVAFMTTQLGRQFVQELDNQSLRALTIGGEKLPSITLPKYDLFHAYGPTECTIFATVRKFKTEHDCLLIGSAIDNYELFVLDADQNLLPMGAVGELCIGGAGVGRGYLNREELTREKFINWKDKRIYRTGDYVKWLENGEIEFVGRIDGQVKLRGLRIELGEIESRLALYSGIQTCCVDVKELGGTQHLCAYYTAGKALDIDALKIFLAETLTAFMIPTAFMQLDSLPLTPNGKFNKKALPEPHITHGEIIPPQNKRQQAIFDLIALIVGSEDFGITDDLFNIGLTSLMAIKVSVMLHNKLGLDVKTGEIIHAKTIEKLAELAKVSGGQEPVVYEKRDAYPLTANQLGVYMACQKDPQALQYNIPFSISLSKTVDIVKLTLAIKSVINKHAYIKTHLQEKQGEVFQVRNDHMEPAVSVSTISDSEIETIQSTFVKPFDLFKAPLYRLEIYVSEQQVYLLSDFHHIICDGGSIQLFFEDITRVYAAENVDAETFTSFDFALEQEALKSSENYARAKDYFAKTLTTEMTALPGDRAKTASREGMLKTQTEKLAGSNIDAFCRLKGLTVNSLFLSAMAYTLHRYTRSPNIQITTISNGRSDAKLSRNMGMLVKTLVISMPITPKDTVESFIALVQQRIFGAIDHEIYPFAEIAAELGIAPGINYAYQAGVLETLTLGKDVLELTQIGKQKPKFDLSIHINQKSEGYEIVAEYDDSLYSREFIKGFINSMHQAVTNLVSDGSQLLAGISLVNELDREKLRGFNKTRAILDEPIVASCFENAAAKYPHRTALIAIDKTMTYRELNSKANRVAHALIKRGVVPEDKICFLLPRDSRLHCALFGILKSGGAFIPVDPEYPTERITQVISDSDAKYIITTREKSRECQFANALIIDDLLLDEATANPVVNSQPGDLCYVIYTSGSTGKPKGVMLEQQGLANYAALIPHNAYVQSLVANTSTLLSITTVSFDVFLKENIVALLNGVTIALANEDQVNNPNDLARFFIDSGADGFSATPSRMTQYIESDAFRQALKQARFIICGGEKFPASLYGTIKNITNGVLFNSYGPTEITISSNAKELTDNRITIGKPLANVVEFVCDPEGNPLPIGVVGELLVGGMGVGRGYLNNPELTDKQFISYDGHRVYKTGDYAKWTPEGEVVILGRLDHQVKLRGLRIELGEIENALNTYPEISQSVVTIKTLKGTEYLCAYYLGKKWINPDNLITQLKKSLTKYMIPGFFTQLEAFPMTPNGKIDSNKLPMPEMVATSEYHSPKNQIEASLCQAFQETLGLERVGARDNFFEIGGTSLLATKLTIKAANVGFQVSYADIFKFQTPEALGDFLGLTETGISEGGCRQSEIKNYDYSKINNILSTNTIKNLKTSNSLGGEAVGDILLTGATGFLGVHILDNYIKNHTGKAYCIVRPKGNITGENRLKTMLMFYFDTDYDELFKTRIIPVEGEITHGDILTTLRDISVDTVINCAANVKHFSAGTDIEDVNIGGVLVLIDYCKEHSAKLIQISTHSIAGTSIKNIPPLGTQLNETDLFMGQDLDNKYVNSKFMAERYILEAMGDGLRGKIMRVGNLMARNADGEFQANFNSNAFMGRLKAFKLIGAFPYSGMDQIIEFAPIDCTAAAILKLVETPDEFTVFHPYNNHTATMADVIVAMRAYGFDIEPTEDGDFKKRLSDSMNDDVLNPYLTGIIAYEETGQHLEISYLSSAQSFTTNMLYRKNFNWPLTTDDYLMKTIDAINGLGFFDITGE